MGPEDHGLPPDNVQEVPVPRVAHRTSPTNIGMGLLSVLAAHDLGFLGEAELLERVDAALTTVEGLERLEGHLYNWYDTVSLAPLEPRYVSTVDSGNLAGALVALAEGLRELGPSAAAARPRAPRLGARRRRWTSGSSTTRGGACSPSGTAPPTPTARASSTRPTTTCSPPRRAWPASSPSPRATCPSCTGSGWDGSSPACTGCPRSSPGAGRCSST